MLKPILPLLADQSQHVYLLPWWDDNFTTVTSSLLLSTSFLTVWMRVIMAGQPAMTHNAHSDFWLMSVKLLDTLQARYTEHYSVFL